MQGKSSEYLDRSGVFCTFVSCFEVVVFVRNTAMRIQYV